MHELINTSVPNGLIPGSHGFSTVAMTRGMSDTLRTKLEMLSGYSHVYSGHDDQYFTQNPESWNHLILATGEHVFSRVVSLLHLLTIRGVQIVWRITLFFLLKKLQHTIQQIF